MVTTAETLPCTALAPFVRCYSFRSFNTGSNPVSKPWFATHEAYLPFFFGPPPVKLFNPLTGRTIYGYQAGAVGIATGYNGEMSFCGNYAFFSIQFKPSGFNQIFGMPSLLFTDNIVGTDDFLDPSVHLFYEQLQEVQERDEADKLEQMALLADSYLLGYLKKRKGINYSNRIAPLSELILKQPGQIMVPQLATIANMSVRNFERCFQEQIGTSPKLFGRIVRFNRALNQKLKEPGKDWTAIAQENGYFDQMHLIKDCKKFTGSSPSVFVRETALLEKDFSQRVHD